MSEEEILDSLEDMATEAAPIEDFDQNGLLLKIAVNGITVQDYVKKLQESDILVAVDGKIYKDGPARLREIFESRTGEEAKWLLSFYRDGQIFDILVKTPIQSNLDWLLSKKPSGLWSNLKSTFMLNLIPIRIMRFIEIHTAFAIY